MRAAPQPSLAAMYALFGTLPQRLGRHAAYTGCSLLPFMSGTCSVFCGAAACCLPRCGSRLAACQKLLPSVDSCRKGTSLYSQSRNSARRTSGFYLRPP